MGRRELDEENIRKLTRVGETSLAVTIPKSIVQKLNLRERQRVIIRLSGESIIINDYKSKKP